jgi:hypothetical protein
VDLQSYSRPTGQVSTKQALRLHGLGASGECKPLLHARTVSRPHLGTQSSHGSRLQRQEHSKEKGGTDQESCGFSLLLQL